MYEEEVFERRRRREEGRERAAAARAFAETGTAAEGAFGSLYPPRDAQQKRLGIAMGEPCQPCSTCFSR